MARFLLLFVSLTVLATGLLVAPSPVQAESNTYEKEIIQSQVRQSFQNLLDLWREELYFEMHDQGQVKSQAILPKSSFAQRMVDLNWKPSLKPAEIQSIQVDYRNFVRLKIQIEFEHKTMPEKKINKEYIFHVILEENQWRYPLGAFIRAPFSGLDILVKKKGKKAAKEGVK